MPEKWQFVFQGYIYTHKKIFNLRTRLEKKYYSKYSKTTITLLCPLLVAPQRGNVFRSNYTL